jgi:hypothetical protein
MKPSRVNMILVILMILIIPGCKKNYIISEKQVILFQLEYVNYAWGYQHNGFIIDNEGNVLSYNNPDDWNFPDKDLSINESKIAENIGKCNPTTIKIPNEELQKYINYIKNIASSKVTAEKNVAADAGSLEFICYQFSENSGMYKGYLIKKEGDFTCENLNFYSKKVAAWMRDINASISRN